MRVGSLSLRDFRNYEEVNLELPPGSTIFSGSNGQGKTNILEAIYYLATLGSWRASDDHDMVRQGAEAAFVGAEV